MIGLARSSLQYQPARSDDDALRLALIRPAKRCGRYGYRKIAELLRIEGWRVNHKKVDLQHRVETAFSSIHLSLKARGQDICQRNSIDPHSTTLPCMRKPTRTNQVSILSADPALPHRGHCFKISNNRTQFRFRHFCQVGYDINHITARTVEIRR